MIIERRSPYSGVYNTMDIDVTQEQMARFEAPNRSETIQDIFPNLSPSEREFLMSGYTDSDWKALFGPADDED